MSDRDFFSGIASITTEAITAENGWSLNYNKPMVGADGDMAIYVKKSNDNHIISYTHFDLRDGFNLKNLYRMFTDKVLDINWAENSDQVDIIEKYGEFSDFMYQKMKMTFPIHDRDLVVQRVYFDNSKQELVKKFHLPVKDTLYYVIVSKSINKCDWPEKEGIVRAKLLFSVTIFEEIDGKIVVKNWQCLDFMGHIPSIAYGFAIKAGVQKYTDFAIRSYHKIYSNSPIEPQSGSRIGSKNYD